LLHDPSVHTAPEVLLGDRATEATDVYGLAATLYELVAGRSIFRSYASESAAEISAHIFCETVSPLSAADVPLELSDLLLWALTADPTARPPSASWFAEELRRIEDHNGWPRTPMIVGATTVLGGWMTR
jgi:serine/threonine protein kinase